ncbi:MAG: hypothetical protein CMO44_02880 [Verrucomicrobiales bacterium]|nr:hypothetical protein [Verrucomicrobiales bacterium]
MQQNKNFFINTLIMFSSFLSGGILIYFFHVFQSSIVQRCHITSTALLFAWLGSLASDVRTTIFWKALGAWVIYSNIFFDMHTHWQGYPRVAKQIILCSIPVLVSYNKMQSKALQLMFWTIVVVIPDISSNIYGNAIMSEIKLFVCCMMIMTRYRYHPLHETLELEHYIWVFFIHDALVVLALWQIYYDFQYNLKKDNTVDEIEMLKKEDIETPKTRKRVITERDLANFFH